MHRGINFKCVVSKYFAARLRTLRPDMILITSSEMLLASGEQTATAVRLACFVLLFTNFQQTKLYILFKT